MLTNGGFDGPTGWSLTNSSGASSIADGVVHFVDEAGDIDRVTQSVPEITNGVSYTVTGTISNRTQGGIDVQLGGVKIGTSVTTNGPFTRTGAAGSAGTAAFAGTGAGAMLDLDDVTCVPT